MPGKAYLSDRQDRKWNIKNGPLFSEQKRKYILKPLKSGLRRVFPLLSTHFNTQRFESVPFNRNGTCRTDSLRTKSKKKFERTVPFLVSLVDKRLARHSALRIRDIAEDDGRRKMADCARSYFLRQILECTLTVKFSGCNDVNSTLAPY